VYDITICAGKFHRRYGDTGFVDSGDFPNINDWFTVNGKEMEVVLKALF